MRTYRFSLAFIFTLVLCTSLAISASAAEAPVFTDVDDSSPWYEAVEYAAENGITCGTGNQKFSPDREITVQEWAVMLCRAFEVELPINSGSDYGKRCLYYAYAKDWINETGLVDPESNICRGNFYASAFSAAGVDVYSSELYEAIPVLTPAENYIRVAIENGLCSTDARPLDLITRGEAIYMIYQMQTTELHSTPPAFLNSMKINNVDEVPLDEYLLELKKNPSSIVEEFRSRDWTYQVDCKYLANLSARFDMNCIGAANYQNKKIYVSVPRATTHELGHFYHKVLKFPEVVEDLYNKEADVAKKVLGEYAAKNYREYFAEFYEYWIFHSGDEEKMGRLADVAPNTFAYFSTLAVSDWVSY